MQSTTINAFATALISLANWSNVATDGDALVVGASDGKETPTGDGPVGDSSIPHMQQSTARNFISDLLCVEGPEYQPTNDEEHRHGAMVFWR